VRRHEEHIVHMVYPVHILYTWNKKCVDMTNIFEIVYILCWNQDVRRYEEHIVHMALEQDGGGNSFRANSFVIGTAVISTHTRRAST
jgi:hypothetical protein